MKYRIRVDLIFESKADALSVVTWLKNSNVMGKVQNLVSEKSFFELEECHHDDNPSQPCVILQHIEKA